MDHLYFLAVDKPFLAQQQALLALLPPEKRARIQGMRFDMDQKLSLYADVLVRCLACRALRVSNDGLVFLQNAFGKPCLMGYPGFHFNISHTRSAIVVALSNREIGVDIERVDKADLRIARRYFTAAEVDWIEAGGAEADERFYTVWTRKEAYLKWRGEGLSIPLSSFETGGELFFSTRRGDYLISAFPSSGGAWGPPIPVTEHELLVMGSALLKSPILNDCKSNRYD